MADEHARRINRFKALAAINVVFGVSGIPLALLVLVDGNGLLALAVFGIGCLYTALGVALWISDNIVNGQKAVSC